MAAGSPTLPPRLTFEAAEAQAQKDMQGEGVADYGSGVSRQLIPELVKRTAGCHVNSASPKNWDIVIRIGADGHVEDAWVDPQTDAGLCIAEKIRTETFDKPPAAPIHLLILLSVH